MVAVESGYAPVPQCGGWLRWRWDYVVPLLDELRLKVAVMWGAAGALVPACARSDSGGAAASLSLGAPHVSGGTGHTFAVRPDAVLAELQLLEQLLRHI